MTKASDNAFPSILITEGTEPSAPAAGKQRLYIDSTTHVLMLTNSSGVESAVGGVLGAWTNYTPTWTATTTNPTLGSTTITGRYKLLDSKTGIVQVYIVITTGGAWNAGSGNYMWSLPSGWTSATGRIQVGPAYVLDNGTTYYAGAARVLAGATVIDSTIVADDSGNKLIAHNKPVTWATGDQIGMTVTIEIQ